MAAVFGSTTLSPTERLVMLALADHADDDGRCYPSIQRLCQRTGLSERAIQNNVRRLSMQGYIRMIDGGGRGKTNLYILDANPAGSAPFLAPPEAGNPAQDAPKAGTFPPHNPAAETPFQAMLGQENPASGALNPAADSENPASGALNPAAGAPEPSRTIKNHQEPYAQGAQDAEAIFKVLSDAAGREAALAFIDHRRAKRARLTLNAARIIAKRLSGHPDPAGVLEDSIANGWTGVFPDKQRSPPAATQPDIAAIMARIPFRGTA